MCESSASRTRISFSHSLDGLIERLEDVGDFELLDTAREQPFERPQRVVVLGRRADHLAVRGDRLVEIVQAKLVHLSEAILELEDLVWALPDLGLAHEHLGQVLPTLHLGEQAIEGAHCALVLGVDSEHSSIAAHRVLHVLELHLVHLRDAQPELDEALGISLELVELGVVERGDRGPAFDHHREALEGAERFFVLTVDAERARVRLERARVVAQALFVEPRDAMQQLDFGEGVVRETDLHLEHADELLALARRVVDRLEYGGRGEWLLLAVLDALERCQGRQMVRLDIENLAIQLDRAVDVVEVLLVELRDSILVADRLGRVRRELGLVLQNAEQLLPVARSLIQDVQAAERRQIVGIELEHLLIGVDRAPHVRELSLVDRADLVEDELLLVRVEDQIGLLGVDGEQLLPAREPEVELDQRVDAAQIFAVDLEDLLVDADGVFLALEHVLFDCAA